MSKAKVLLFKPSGKYYCEEEWEIPESVPHWHDGRPVSVIGPYDMQYSPDFRRIGGGPVLIETQEPWGYPHLFPGINPHQPIRSVHE
jgi:hypothetical protein